MERFKRAMKLAAMTLSLCFVFALSLTAQAATEYTTGATYVNPNWNAKGEAYSELKMRMSIVDEATFDVVYPMTASADATITVSSNKKALEAEVTKVVNEEYDEEYENWYGLTPPDSKYVYVDPSQVTNVESFEDDGETYQYGEYTDAAGKLHYVDYDKTLGKYYYHSGYEYVSRQNCVQADGSKYQYAVATVTLNSTKAGTYKVTVNVNGASYVVKVFVTKNGTGFTQAKFDGATIDKYTDQGKTAKNTYGFSSKMKVAGDAKKGKFKVSAVKGIKVTGIVSAYVDKNGKAIYKAGKNGSTVTLSKEYASIDRDTTGRYVKPAKKYTKIFVSYKDKYLKTSVKYSVTKKHGVKEIKCVEKAQDGTKRVSYLTYDNSADYTLWAY